jgi:hypothetical protein
VEAAGQLAHAAAALAVALVERLQTVTFWGGDAVEADRLDRSRGRRLRPAGRKLGLALVGFAAASCGGARLPAASRSASAVALARAGRLAADAKADGETGDEGQRVASTELRFVAMARSYITRSSAPAS